MELSENAKFHGLHGTVEQDWSVVVPLTNERRNEIGWLPVQSMASQPALETDTVPATRCGRLQQRVQSAGGAIRLLQVVFSVSELLLMAAIVFINFESIAIWAWLVVALIAGVIRSFYQLFANSPPTRCFNGASPQHVSKTLISFFFIFCFNRIFSSPSCTSWSV